MNTGQIHLPRIPSIHGRTVSAKTLRIEFPDYSREAATWFPPGSSGTIHEPIPTICLHFHQGIWYEALTTDADTRVVTVDQLKRWYGKMGNWTCQDEIRTVIGEVK